MSSKWRTIQSDVLVKDRWIELRADRCITPGGAEISPYYVVRYPDWVHVVALTTDDRIVLVRQYRHGVGEMVLEVPGGVVDATDADFELGARRELEEETGYTSSKWMAITSLYPSPASQTNKVHVFLALDAVCNGNRDLDEGEEGLEVLNLPIDEVTRGLKDGLLGHSLHVAAVLMALAFAGKLYPARVTA